MRATNYVTSKTAITLISTFTLKREIDVIAANFERKKAHICEVVTHLKTGIQYVKN
jgi:hypothetical protein